MAKTSQHIYSRHAEEAAKLLGQSVREARIAHRMTTESLANRAGISRALLYRIENGDPHCGMGSVFEVATIVGVPLFEDDRRNVSARLAQSKEKLALMPKSVRGAKRALNDDF